MLHVLALAAAVSLGGGTVAAAPARSRDSDKEPPTPEELAKEREARKAYLEQLDRERAEYRRQREAEEAARHPATQSKPKSESLKRLLGKARRRP